MATDPVPAPEDLAALRKGDRVIIECEGERHYGTVGPRTPGGNFRVAWCAGWNPLFPHLPGHWYVEFGPGGEPQGPSRIVESCGGRRDER